MKHRGSAVRILSLVGIMGFGFASMAHAAVDRKAVQSARVQRVELARLGKQNVVRAGHTLAQINTSKNYAQRLASSLRFSLSFEKSVIRAENHLIAAQNRLIAKYHVTGDSSFANQALLYQTSISIDTTLLTGIQPGILANVMALSTSGISGGVYTNLASEALYFANVVRALATRPPFTIPPATAII